MGVDELHSHRPFTDCRGAAFGRPGADVARREHAGNIGLQQIVDARGGTGEDEAVLVAADRLAEPLRARQRAEKRKMNEKGTRSPLFSVTASR